MDIFQIITFILILILIIIIICEIINRKCDENIINVRYLFKKPKYTNYIIDSIGITRSITHFWPNPKSDLDSHTDIIAYCHNPKNNKFYYILIYSTNYKNLPMEELEKQGNVKYHMITNIKIVEPNKYYKFILDNYKYRITELYNLNNEKWTIGEVYDLYTQILQIPYHKLKFNCHHVVNFVLDVVVDDKNRNKLNRFEFDNSENYKPLLYIYNYLKEKMGFKVVDKFNLKKLKEVLKIGHNN